MLGVFFALLVVTALTAHYVLVERPRQRARELEGPRPAPLPLSEIIDHLPKGVFLQPTFTWGRLRSDGDVDLGIHPLLLGLVGRSGGIQPPDRLGRVEDGDPIAGIIVNGRELTVRSPLSGRIVATNLRADADPTWRGVTWDDGSWVCRIRPDRLADQIGGWWISDEAVEWTRQKYGEVRDRLLALASSREPEVLLADGGEIPVGILRQLDAGAWQEFEAEFLDSSS